MKRNIFKQLCLAFCFLISMNAFGDTYVTIGGLKYQLDGTEAYVAGYEGNPTDVVIPATIVSDGLTFKVTKISRESFYKCTSLTSVRAEGENLKYINGDDGAFAGCTSLVSVSFPYVEYIEGGSFDGCTKLQNVWLGYNIKTINGSGNYYILGDERNGAFKNCTMLSYIVLPSSCTSLGSYVFYGCNRLQAIIYLGSQTSACGSNANVYNMNNLLTWNSKSFMYNGSSPSVTFTSDLPAGFQPKYGIELPPLEKNVGTYKTMIPVTFANNDMEFTTNIPYSYTITPVTLTARVKDATKVYGDANPQFQTEYTGFITGEDESVITNKGTYSTSATASSTVGTYNVTQSGAAAQNYTFQYEPGTLTVTKAPLTMTPRNKTMTYGDRVPTLEVDYAGLKNNESKPAWITEPTITTTATSESNAGTYPITIAGGEARNYEVTYNQGTLTINKATLTATTKNATREYGDENPDFEMSYLGLKNGEKKPEWVAAPTFATPATRTSPAGTYAITASGGEAKNYLVQYVNDGLLTVTKASLTATARSMSRLQGEVNPNFVIDYVGFKNNETALALTQEPIATTTATLYSRPGTYPITVSGGIAMNYEFTYVNGTLTVLPTEEPGDPTDNMLTLNSISGNKGTQVILPIGLTNQKEITGFQLDLYLPAGVTVATNSKGKMIIEMTERMDGNYTVSGNQRDGFVRIVGYSADGDAFTGNSGDILNVTLNIDENMADGDYTVRLKDIVLSDVNNTEYHPADVGATLMVKSYVLGDVDNSGAININDVVCIINYILGKTVNNFIAEAADVDGSGAININDVVTIINRYILMKTSAPAMFAEYASHRAASVDENYLHLDDINIDPGETKEVKMLMTNTGTVAAIQGKLTLPAGLSIVKKSNGRVDAQNINARSEDFTLSTNVLEDGSLTFAQYSADGFTYEGSEGGIFTFKIKADETATAGTYSLTLSNVVLSIDGVGYDIPDRMSSLTVTGTSGIGLTPNPSPTGEGNYYTLDGQKLQGKPTQKGVYIQNGKKIIVK